MTLPLRTPVFGVRRGGGILRAAGMRWASMNAPVWRAG
jgi:hypothetical protein